MRSQSCQRLQHLDLSHNDIENVNELNPLIPLRFLQRLTLAGGPLIEREGSFYRARVLRRLQQLEVLDDDIASAREKVKALVMHGSDVAARQRVFAKHLPGQQFTNFLYVVCMISSAACSSLTILSCSSCIASSAVRRSSSRTTRTSRGSSARRA